MKFCVVVCLIALPASAEIYQWRDSQGQLHFSDRVPENTEHTQADLTPISTYEAVIPDIQDDSDARRARNESRLAEKKKQRLASEKAARQSLAREKKCRQARQDYRSGEGRYRSQPGLDDLKKARRRIEAINDRIKSFCY